MYQDREDWRDDIVLELEDGHFGEHDVETWSLEDFADIVAPARAPL